MMMPNLTTPIEDFSIGISGPNGEKGGQSITIYGDPIHATVEDVIKSYEAMTLSDFLAKEARHGIGNYLLLIRNGTKTRIITSNGYCGGYIFQSDAGLNIGTTLASVLPEYPAFDSFGLCFLLTAHPKSAWSSMPLTTPFADTHRLPPCSIFEFEGASITSGRSYLAASAGLAPAADFAAALAEVAESFSSYYKRTGTKPTVMFSGGVDSLVLYLALAEHMDPKDIRVITMKTAAGRSTANGHERALPVARNSGMTIEVLEDRSLTDISIMEATAALMRKDIIGSRAPHISLLQYGVKDHIIHGQNMDSIVKHNMEILQLNKDRGYLSDSMQSLASGDKEAQQHRVFLQNLQATDAYLTDEAFQVSTVRTYAKWRKGIPDPAPGREGILRGLLTSQFANVLPYPIKPASHCSMLDAADREAGLFRDFMAPDSLGLPRLVAAARFYTYSAIASKRLATFSIPTGGSVQLAAMSGPIISYYAGRPKELLDASQPKREVFAYAQRRTGKPYHELSTPSSDDLKKFPRQNRDDSKADGFLQQYRRLLDPKNSRTLDAIPDPKIQNNITKYYKEKVSTLNDESFSGLFRTILGLELLLENVSTRSSRSGKEAAIAPTKRWWQPFGR
ncbi:hypothetical protein RB623_02965 [Mesorhizobium sp. LHD-90]|uniref:hypothetical protein n=1 Tax=Mesorhizobium sp. LHD-90 TaxID=3071414 RepID=UPI0027DF03BC|nr:hypothetical protein [Mesorhizobium sp. LHD-90]MDQ6433012.1 hypothetical protein [Mesorhizobium sp. LHD-90]